MQASDPTTTLDGRQTCRTILDALDQLGIPDTEKDAVATIHAGEIQCPNGRTPGMVFVGTGSPGDCNRRCLRMPDSNTFRARLAEGTAISGAVAELHGATVRSDGVVSLLDGRRVRGLEFQPGVRYEHYDFTSRQHYIVRLALRLLGEEERCYRPFNEELLPGVKLLDYAAIKGVHLPHVKKLLALIQEISYLQVSKVEIEEILRLAGMQFPGPTWRMSCPE